MCLIIEYLPFFIFFRKTSFILKKGLWEFNIVVYIFVDSFDNFYQVIYVMS